MVSMFSLAREIHQLSLNSCTENVNKQIYKMTFFHDWNVDSRCKMMMIFELNSQMS